MKLETASKNFVNNLFKIIDNNEIDGLNLYQLEYFKDHDFIESMCSKEFTEADIQDFYRELISCMDGEPVVTSEPVQASSISINDTMLRLNLTLITEHAKQQGVKLSQVEILKDWIKKLCTKELSDSEIQSLYSAMLSNYVAYLQTKKRVLTEATRQDRFKEFRKRRLQSDLKCLLGYI